MGLKGLALLFICILNLFLYGLRNLEAIYAILSFVALGSILLSVSCVLQPFSRAHQALIVKGVGTEVVFPVF